jgi:hypothetical protein
MEPLGQSDFSRELHRLHRQHLAARASKDQAAIDEAIDAFAVFWRYTRAQRLDDYFAQQETACISTETSKSRSNAS